MNWAIECEHGTVLHIDDRLDGYETLIAAAPEMLEALERIISKFDAGENIEGHCICDAREAIANARGHSQHNKLL